jgi:hypothetical protein
MPTGILGGLRRVSLLGVGYHGGDARHRSRVGGWAHAELGR